MGRAALRGLCGGAHAAVYLFILLVFKCLNFNSETLMPIFQLVPPFGGTIIAVCFIDKERVSKWWVSAAVYAAVFAGLSAFAVWLNLIGEVHRIFYGMLPESTIDTQTAVIAAVYAAASAAGIVISLITAIFGSIRIKRLVNSREVKHT